MGGKLAGMVGYNRALATQDHRSKVTGAAQDAGEVRAAQLALVKEMPEHIDRGHVGPFDLLGLVALNEGAENLEVIFLIARESFLAG